MLSIPDRGRGHAVSVGHHVTKMLAVNKIDTEVNNAISYKKEQLDYLKSEIILKNKLIGNLTSAMTKN